jgi:hypothetical protein
MANTFKNYASGNTGTSAITVYTCPGATQTTVIGMSLCNLTPNPISANVALTTSGGTTFFMLKSANIPVGGALVPVGGDQKLVLEAGDYISVQSDTASSIDTILSVLEIS